MPCAGAGPEDGVDPAGILNGRDPELVIGDLPDQLSVFLDVLADLNRECCREYERAMDGHETSMLVEEEAYIDENGCVSVPNAGPLGVDAGAAAKLIGPGEKLYTGYTREYIRAFAVSGEDLRGQIIKGKLTVESLPVFEYT